MIPRLGRFARSLLALRTRGEAGYVAVVFTMIVASGLFLGAAAIAVDTGRWYTESERVQKAADAGALAGVPYLPYDLPAATRAAREAVRRNGFPTLADSQIKVTQGKVDSQLTVAVSTTVHNAFGSGFGVTSTSVSRSATADYKSAAPMGSPCNTFGNEPTAGTSTATTGYISPKPVGTVRDTTLADCTSNPMLWGGVQGAKTNKSNGDRYQNTYCKAPAAQPSSATYGCTVPTNNEYREDGYFWVIQVRPEAVGQMIDLQIYDGAFVPTGSDCKGNVPGSNTLLLPLQSDLWNNMNSFVTSDGKARYSRDYTTTGVPFCNGDQTPGEIASGTMDKPVTSFAVRRPSESVSPKAGELITGCTTQLRGRAAASASDTLSALKEKTTQGGNTSNGAYNRHLAQLFHNWYSLCSFQATEAGDYYIQVRTNVAFDSSNSRALTNSNNLESMISKGSPTVTADAGTYRNTAYSNTFALRANVPGYAKYVSVSGFDAMPMFVNASSATANFNLIRVLPGAAGQFITFTFFDVADSATAKGTVQVFSPAEAKDGAVAVPTSPAGCTSRLAPATTESAVLVGCSVPVTNAANNGNIQTITIPVPSKYTCDYKVVTGCWYKVKVTLGGDDVRDFTTWSATIVGDPVRLIE